MDELLELTEVDRGRVGKTHHQLGKAQWLEAQHGPKSRRWADKGFTGCPDIAGS